jgi:hypothetical protein
MDMKQSLCWFEKLRYRLKLAAVMVQTLNRDRRLAPSGAKNAQARFLRKENRNAPQPQANRLVRKCGELR